MTKKLFHGSCHCGKVKYQVNYDLSKGSTKCNCTFCFKNSFWWGSQSTLEDLEITQGQDSIAEYTNKREEGYCVFCKNCGTTIFRKTEKSDWSVEGYSINIHSLDDISVEELNSISVGYINGKDNSYAKITDPEIIKTLY
jgi:hypothetical protein